MSRSHADPIAIEQSVFDEELQAKRVVIVGSGFGEYKSSPNEIKIVEIEKQVIVKELEIKTIEVPVIIIQKEIQTIEVPVIVNQVVEQVRTVEVIKEVPGPVKIETVTIDREVPVYITKTEYKDMPKFLIVCLALQAIISLFLMLKK